MIHRIETPVFIADAVDRLQTTLASIQLQSGSIATALIAEIYPLIELSTAEETKGAALFWTNKTDFAGVNPNDNFTSLSFFYANDSIAYGENFTSINLDLIVWINTNSIKYDYRPIKYNIQGLVLSTLKELSEVSNLSLYAEKNNIFTGELAQQNAFSLEAPYTGFRINFDYQLDNCQTYDYNINPYC